MAIILNDNIKINAGKPSESKYLNTGNTAYTSPAAVCAAIPVPERHVGLTVLVVSGSVNAEYWFRENVTTLIPKTVDIDIPEGNFITGATNLGYFSGTTGVQRLNISSSISYPDYDGYYCSLYNYYYWGTDNKIHIGAPNDGIPKRGYIKNELPVKSWIWNDGGGSNLNSTGWILADGDVTQTIGATPTGYGVYYDNVTCYPFTASTWTTTCSNGGAQATVVALFGSLLTGTTIAIGARPYAYEDENKLHFRTIISDTTGLIKVWDDEANIHISGASAVLSATNEGTGENIFLGQTGTTLYFKRIRGSGDTTVSTVGESIIVHTIASSGGTGTLTGATNIGTGIGVYDSLSGNTLQFNSLLGSGGTTVSYAGDGETIIINTTVDDTLLTGSTNPVANSAITTVINQILDVIAVPPTYYAPTVSLTPAITQTVEMGTTLGSFTADITFTQCDAGAANGYELCRNGSLCSSSATNTITGETNITSVISYVGKASYDCGATKNNNLGIPDPTGKILAGTISSTRTITPVLRQFWGNAASVPATSADIRALGCCNFCGTNGFCLCTGTINTVFAFAVPNTKTKLSVSDICNLGADITSCYVLNGGGSFVVCDAGGNSHNYNVYVMQTAIPYPTATCHCIIVS